MAKYLLRNKGRQVEDVKVTRLDGASDVLHIQAGKSEVFEGTLVSYNENKVVTKNIG